MNKAIDDVIKMIPGQAGGQVDIDEVHSESDRITRSVARIQSPIRGWIFSRGSRVKYTNTDL